jgi:hypothetical protein
MYSQLRFDLHINKEKPEYIVSMVEQLLNHVECLEKSLTATRNKFFAETAKSKKDYEFLEDEYSNLEHKLRDVESLKKMVG